MLHCIIQQVSNYLRKTAYDPYKNLSRDILLTPKQPFQAYKVASNYKSHPSFRASKYSILSPAGRAIKAERKLSVSLFAFNETVVCVNNKTNQKRYFI